MENKRIVAVAALTLFAAVSLSSCKKKDSDESKKLSCDLTSATVKTSTDSSNYTFSYNSDKKINKIVFISSDKKVTTTSLTYGGSTVNAIANDGTKNISKMILTLNSSGRISRQESRDPANDTIKSYTNYTYGSNGELLSYNNKQGKNAEYITTIGNNNGNISSIASNTSITTLEYFADQTWRAGDYIDILQRLEIGNNFYLVNKNLVKSFTSGTDITNFNYTYDNNNNISSMQIIGGGSTIDVIYQHQCQ